MVDPVMVSSTNKPIFFIDLSEQNSNPMIPDSFISNHLKGKVQSMKLKLTSNASDRAWEVELDGQTFARGWKHFSVHHCVRNDDILSFRQDGDMVFHVTPLGRSFSHQMQLISSTSEDENDRFDDDEHNIFDDDDENADVGDDDDEYSASDEELYPNRISSKKRARTETASSSKNSYLVAHVTSSSLRRNNMCLSSKFARSNGLNNRQCEIDLRNQDGKSWTLDLRHNKTTGQAYICRGWTSFCRGNGIEAESFCRFKFVQSGTKPVLQLCPNTSTILPQGNSSKTNGKRNVPETEGDEIGTEDCSESASMHQNRAAALELKPYMIKSGQLRLPASFSRENGINEAGEIIIVNKDGVEWKLLLVSIKGRGQFNIKGLKDCFVANGIKKVGDSFTLDVIRGGTSPILKICSKIKEASFDGHKTSNRRPPRMIQASRAEEEMETCDKKKARVSAEGGSSSKLSVDPEDLQNKKPHQPCSISDQVRKVKQSIVHTLADVKQLRSELEIKEKNLEASLLEIDGLGEKILGIGKFFNINQV